MRIIPATHRVVAAFAATLLLTLGLAIAITTTPSSGAVSDGWSVIDVGYHHSCGVTTIGEAYCWGAGISGDETLPVLVPAPAGVTWATVDTGLYHSCGLSTDGDLFCWGNDGLEVGTLGNGPVVADQFLYPDPTPVVTPPGVTWASISAGQHSCALSTDGDAYCWGLGERGQIGDGADENRDVPTLVTAPPGVEWASVHAGAPDSNNFGSQHSCAISTTGAGYCWGADTHGQLGDGADLVDTNTPSLVVTPPGETWASIRPGMNHTCGVTSSGAGFCWGRGEGGRLGSGNLGGPFPEPKAVTTPLGVTWAEIVAGGFTTCGTTTDGDLFCWGSEGLTGTLGDGPLVLGIEETPVPVVTPAEVSGWRTVSTGHHHTCAVDVDDVGWCWGIDSYGKLGNGAANTDVEIPTRVLGEEPTGGPQVIEQFFLSGEYPVDEPPFQIRALASSFLEVTFTSDTPGVCSIGNVLRNGNFTTAVLTFLAPGTCTITATQPGDQSWDPAPPQTRSVTVVGVPASVELADLEQTYDGTPRAVTVATNPAGLATTVTYDGSEVPPTDAGSYAVVATVTEAGYDPVEATGTLVISPAAQSIDFGPLAGIAFGDPAVPLSATATSGLPVAFTVAGPCTTDGSSVTATNAGTCTVTATQPGDGNWLAAPPVEQDLIIDGAASTITVTDWSTTYDGTPKPVTVTTDPAGLATTVTYDGSETPPTDAGSYAVVVTVVEPGYVPEQVTGTLTIAQAPQTITVEPFRLQVFGDGGIDLITSATSGLPVELSATGVCTLTGNHVNQTGAGDCFVTLTQPGDDNWSAAPELVVNAEITKALPTATLTGPAGDTAVGTDTTFTATVSGPGTPTGTVTFTTDTGATEDVALVGGVATWTTAELALGDHVVSADYSGGPDHLPVSATTIDHTVVTAPLSLTGLADEVEVGDVVTVTATGFEPGEDVEFVFESTPVVVGSAIADAVGAATITFTVPDVEAGAHQLTATGTTSGLAVSVATAVIAAATPTDPTPTPTTVPSPTTAPVTPTTTAGQPIAAAAAQSANPAAQSSAAAQGSLPVTGTGTTTTLVALGGALLLIGCVAVLAVRRRQR